MLQQKLLRNISKTKAEFILRLPFVTNRRFSSAGIYKKNKKFIFNYAMNNLLPELKKDEDYSYLSLSFSQSLQAVCKDLSQALTNCFKSGFGFPEFKKKGKVKDSFRVPQKFSLSKKHVKLPKIGSVSMKRHRKIEGTPKNITISLDVDQWYVSVCCELKKHKKLKKTKSSVGIDVGVKRLYFISLLVLYAFIIIYINTFTFKVV